MISEITLVRTLQKLFGDGAETGPGIRVPALQS